MTAHLMEAAWVFNHRAVGGNAAELLLLELGRDAVMRRHCESFLPQNQRSMSWAGTSHSLDNERSGLVCNVRAMSPAAPSLHATADFLPDGTFHGGAVPLRTSSDGPPSHLHSTSLSQQSRQIKENTAPSLSIAADVRNTEEP